RTAPGHGSGLCIWSARTKCIARFHGLALFGRRLVGRVVAQVPVHAVDASGARPVHFADEFSVFIGDGDLDLTFFLRWRGRGVFLVRTLLRRLRRHGVFQVVAEQRTFGRILAGELFLPGAPGPLAQTPEG